MVFRAEAFTKLKESRGWSFEDIAAKGDISDRCIRRAVDSGQITPKKAVELAKALKELGAPDVRLTEGGDQPDSGSVPLIEITFKFPGDPEAVRVSGKGRAYAPSTRDVVGVCG